MELICDTLATPTPSSFRHANTHMHTLVHTRGRSLGCEFICVTSCSFFTAFPLFFLSVLSSEAKKLSHCCLTVSFRSLPSSFSPFPNCAAFHLQVLLFAHLIFLWFESVFLVILSLLPLDSGDYVCIWNPLHLDMAIILLMKWRQMGLNHSSTQTVHFSSLVCPSLNQSLYFGSFTKKQNNNNNVCLYQMMCSDGMVIFKQSWLLIFEMHFYLIILFKWLIEHIWMWLEINQSSPKQHLLSPSEGIL